MKCWKLDFKNFLVTQQINSVLTATVLIKLFSLIVDFISLVRMMTLSTNDGV